MSIREEIKGQLNQSIFNSLPRKGETHTGLGQKTRVPDSDVAKDKPVSRRSTPLTFHRDFSVSTRRKRKKKAVSRAPEVEHVGVFFCSFSHEKFSLKHVLSMVCVLFEAFDLPQWFHVFLLFVAVSSTFSDFKLATPLSEVK